MIILMSHKKRCQNGFDPNGSRITRRPAERNEAKPVGCMRLLGAMPQTKRLFTLDMLTIL